MVLLPLEPLISGVTDVRRLIPERPRQVAVALLHVGMRGVALGLAGAVRRDLSGARPAPPIAGPRLLNLLPTWARRLEVRGRIAGDLGLAARASLDLIAECGQATANADR